MIANKKLITLLFPPLILLLLSTACTPKKKKKKNRFWGECISNINCPDKKICIHHKCVSLDSQGTTQALKPPLGMVYIPPGSFIMGSNSGSPMEKPQIEVSTGGYFIDILEVTRKKYDICIKKGICTAPACNSPSPDAAVSCVTWEQAVKYCIFAGKRLPSEEEWEKAARGVDARTYPWGEQSPTCSRANFNECKNNTLVDYNQRLEGKSPFGTLDQAGNVWEWTSTALWPWDKKKDPEMLSAGYKPLKQISHELQSEHRVVRGGSIADGQLGVRTTIKQLLKKNMSSRLVGFRCAKDVVK
ncbi:MAG: formylglycine-generating enzyme family protein [Deltaproteobacteria bacterium]|nr:formylglycine-generating enzyme family protein [Deltaproteobacteria bacterium]